MMKAFQVFKADHGDFVRDVAYDYYGKRIATCSSDGSVKVWDQTAHGEWQCVSTLPRSNAGAINRVGWAHPEFGQVIVTCSGGRGVAIYEEHHDTTKGSTVWQRRCQLTEAAGSVECVAFAPRHLGLRVASASLDGQVRVYECSDAAVMTAWPLVETFDAGRRECTALSWNTNPFEPPALAVAAGATARVWEFNEAYARWVCLANLPGHMGLVHDVAWAPNLSRSYHLIATACADDVARVYKLWPRGKPAALLAALTDAVAAGAAAPAAPAAAPAAGAAADGATAVATQAQAVAAAAGGGAGATADAASGASTAGEPTVELVATLSAHRSQVWRVAWNVTGTALATTGEDGAVRLWSAGLDGTWGQVLVAGGPQF